MGQFLVRGIKEIQGIKIRQQRVRCEIDQK
jgi:hypothetical protein